MTSFIGSLISEPTAFIIVELTGPKYDLMLQGRALPYRNLTFEGVMRAESTWYPGNPQGTLQVLGAQENPTTINGMWKDRFMASTDALGLPVISGRTARATFNGSDVGNIRDLVEIVDGFRMRGQLIEMKWDQFTRQGLLKRFRHSWLRREDVEWEMEFEWINRGEPPSPVAFGVRVPITDILTQVNAAIANLKTTLNAPFAFVSSIVNEINNALDTLTTAVDALADLTKNAVDASLAPLQVARTTLSTLQTIKDVANDIADTFEGRPARAQRISADIRLAKQVLVGGDTSVQEGASGSTGGAAGGTGAGTQGGQVVAVDTTLAAPTAAPQTTSQTETAGIAQLTHEQALQAEAVKRNVRAAARQLKAVAVLRASEIEAEAIRIPDIKSFTAPEGINLRDVSTKYYGTPEEWKRLLTYNNLKDSKLKAGQIILIPPARLREEC